MRPAEKTIALLITLVALTVAPRAARAATRIEVPVSYVTTIGNGAETRLLVRFQIPDSLAGRRILFASCEVGITPDTCGDLPLSVLAAPIAQPWTPGLITWSQGWDSAGADFTLAGSTDVVVSIPTGIGAFSITEWLQAVVNGGRENDGFLLMPLWSSTDECHHLLPDPTNNGRVIIKFSE